MDLTSCLGMLGLGAFESFIVAETEKWGHVIRAANIRLD
jgi:hypothetical protein